MFCTYKWMTFLSTICLMCNPTLQMQSGSNVKNKRQNIPAPKLYSKLSIKLPEWQSKLVLGHPWPQQSWPRPELSSDPSGLAGTGHRWCPGFGSRFPEVEFAAGGRRACGCRCRHSRTPSLGGQWSLLRTASRSTWARSANPEKRNRQRETSLKINLLAVMVKKVTVFFKKNGPSLASFSFIFGLFKQTIQILQQINVKKCPSSIWCQDSNSQPSDYKSPPLITRPVFPPKVTGFTY